MTKYKDAYTEVYEILEQLDEEEYNKIPSNVITVSDKLLKYALPKADAVIREQL